MGISTKTVQAAAATSSGTQDITLSGFGTVKAYIVLVTYALTNGTTAAHLGWSIGFSDGNAGYALWCASEDNLGTTDTYRGQDTTEVIQLWDQTANTTLEAEANHDSFITDGVRINWATAPAAAHMMTFIFFGGSDLSVFAGEFNHTNARTVNQSHTGFGFESDVCFFIGNTGGKDSNPSGLGQVGLGIAVNGDLAAMSADGQIQAGCAYRDGNGSAGSLVELSTDKLVGGWDSGANNWSRYLQLVSFDADGLTLVQQGLNDFDIRFFVLALNFGGVGDAYLTDLAGPTGTGDFNPTGIGFTPGFVLLFPWITPAADTIYNNSGPNGGGQQVVGLADGTREYSVQVYNDVGATTSATASRVDDSFVYVRHDDDSGDEIVGTLTSFGSGDFHVDITTCVDTTTRWAYLAIEEIADAGGIAPAVAAYHHNYHNLR